jgi:multicomponent Na+:H+ antiporter subunit F
MNLTTLIMVGIVPLLGVALLLALFRLIRGPQLSDRVVALDLIAMPGIGIAAACAVAFDQPSLLDAATVIALIAFLSTVAFAYYIERMM